MRGNERACGVYGEVRSEIGERNMIERVGGSAEMGGGGCAVTSVYWNS